MTYACFVLYHVHFATEADEPIPLVDRLVSVEADSPKQAAILLVESDRVPQNRPLHWARVVLSAHPSGVPSLVMRFPMTSITEIPLDSSPARGERPTQSMICEDRTRQLSALRQKSPQRLIAIYRLATNTPEPQQLPRGLGFTGMIEAILQYEFATERVPDEVATKEVHKEVATGKVQDESQKVSQIGSESAITSVVVPPRPRARMAEFRAFCEGGALVFTGLLLAALYRIMA